VSFVANVDPAKGTSDVKRFISDTDRKSPAKCNSSFIIDSLLVTATAIEKEIRLRVFLLEDGSLLYSKNLNKTNIDSLLIAPISRTGTFASKSEIKESEFDEFYRTVLRNELSVSGYISDNKLFLNFATKFTQVNGPSILKTLMDVTAMALTSSHDYSNFYLNSYGNSHIATHTSLDITLSMSTFAPVKIAPNYGVWEKMATTMRPNQFGGKTKVVYSYMNNYHYAGYYDIIGGKYLVYRFNEKKDD
jgi:hypothetical protein